MPVFLLIILSMKVIHSVRSRILVLSTTLFVLLLILYTATLAHMANRFSFVNYSQSTSSLLWMVTSSIEGDLNDIDALVTRVSIDSELKNILSAFSERSWRDYYIRFESMVQSNPAYRAIDRFIIMDSMMEHFLQVGESAATGRPINRDTFLQEIASLEEEGAFSRIFTSYLSYGRYPAIAALRPIIDYNTGRTLGYVYVSVNMHTLLADLYSYQRMYSAEIYIENNGTAYRVDDGGIILSDIPQSSGTVFSTGTATAAKTIDGRYILTVVPERSDFSLRQVYSAPTILGGHGADGVPVLLFITGLLVFLIMLVLSIYLNKAIYKPVRKLSKCIEKIQQSDFSQDEDINTDDEFGIIGRGINRLSSEVVDLMDKRVEDERNKIELEYRMLQNQINPHFLYNTFNAIKWMATIQGATGIGEMVTSLSRLMKNISKRDDSLVSLKDEISFIDDYMVIMKYRYGSTISYCRNIQEDAEDILIPRFTLQPIVENAIFHGIEPKGTGAIAIVAESFGDYCTIMVADNGIGFDKSSERKQGDGVFRNIGLDNIRQRLEYTYHDDASLEIKSRTGVGTVCMIKIKKGEVRNHE